MDAATQWLRGPDGCSDVYADDIVPVFELTLAPEVWAALADEFAHPNERDTAGLPLKPYHPVAAFRYGDEVVHDAWVRLRGNPFFSWRGPKMQLLVSFNERDPNGRFHGLRKLAFDAPFYDPSILHERLAAHVLRSLGLPGPCVNHAWLRINGADYGLFVNKEHVDREFLERTFPANPDGDLFKSGWERKTNDATGTNARRDLLGQTTDPSALARLVDVPQAVRVWAAEAALPHPDGFACCQNNFYLYDQPGVGFAWIPYDLDYTFGGSPTFSEVPVDWPPLFPSPRWTPPVLRAVLSTPGGSLAFVDAFARATDAMDPTRLQPLIERWDAQIQPLIDVDPNLHFERPDHATHVRALADFVAERHAFASRWLACQRGEQSRDADGDGTRWCLDCDDADPLARPGGVEVCDQRDNDCDGAADEGQRACLDCTEVVAGDALFIACPQAVSAAQASAQCVGVGGALATPRSEVEQRALRDWAVVTGGGLAWLGLSDAGREGEFVERAAEAEGGALVPPPWSPGQPNGGDEENCVALEAPTGAWSDVDCGRLLPFMCRLPASP